MKKNGRKYRKIQREKERRKQEQISVRRHIDQEVNDINTAFLSMSHIITRNPILQDSQKVQKEYIKRLTRYLKAGSWHRRKFVNAELSAYEKIISEATSEERPHDISFYKYFILLDVIHILGYKLKSADEKKLEALKVKYYVDFDIDGTNKRLVDNIFRSFTGGNKKIRLLGKMPELTRESEYIQLMAQNDLFRRTEPTEIMVTATMSAGKSTFINALTGKYICLSQNMACTSKIHCIVNKAFEDGFSYEYDHDLILTAGREELFNNNELNSSDKIVVGTYFEGYLRNQRIIVSDSPGVNFSGDQDHKEITDKLLKRKNYNLLIYIMNATQLATNDESDHLDYVKRTIGRTPLMFVINKIDAYDIEEERIADTVARQIEYLKKKGFKDPIVCPVSSRAGYLSKRFSNGVLSRTEKREIYNYVDKFDQMNLPEYYAKAFKKVKVKDSEIEEEQLLKTSGLAYVEKIIMALATGGKTNGTDLR